jgi:hypothetical protein
MLPFTVVWPMSLLRAWRVLFWLRVVLGHFFGLFPSVAIATPKMPGVVIMKGPVTALNTKKNGPWTLILSILAVFSKLW